MKKTILLSLALVFVMVALAPAVVITVPSDYTTIQAGIDAAATGDIVVVALGIYNENIHFNDENIVVTSTDPNNPAVVAATVIQGDGTTSVVTFESNMIDARCQITGFTITGGYGTENSMLPGIYWGAGVYCYQASPTIKGNVITGNFAPPPGENEVGYGGGIGCLESNATITRNIIKQNTAYAGAGIMVLANAQIISNLIYDNSADIGGGVILLSAGNLINNTLASNVADIAGNVYASGQCLLLNNIICSAIDGGGIYWEGPAEQGTIEYNNLWNNAGGNYVEMADLTGVNGNISMDPLFVNTAVNDYHLLDDSPCINTGDPDFAAGTDQMDLDGQVRVFASRVDMGADEYVGYIKPIADAGPNQHYLEIELVTLDGSGSYFYDPCGIMAFQWTQVAGPSVLLSEAAVMQPTFMPEFEDEYRFELVVTDGISTSMPDETLVVVGNRPPVADAGPNVTSHVPQQVTLDGTASYDPDPGSQLTYKWTQLQGPNVVLGDVNTATPYFDCIEEGLYEFELVVSDGFDDSEPSTVQVTAVTITVNQQDLGLAAVGTYAHYPDISGDRVVCGVGSACDVTWADKCIDLETGQISSLFGSYLIQPKLDGDILVWFKYGNSFGNPWTHEPSNCSVFVRNIAAKEQKTLRQWTWSESYGHPVVSGYKVVWMEHLNLNPNKPNNNWWNTPFNICGADLTDWDNPTYFTIDENVGSHDPYPCHSYSSDFDDVIDISGDIVVWEGDGDIYGADISDLDNISLFTICSAPGRQFDPAISGNLVVWTDMRNDDGDIYGADIADTENVRVFEIIKDNGAQQQPAIDARMIVYVDGDLIGEIKLCCISKHGVLHVPLADEPYGTGPAIDADRIVWQTTFYGQLMGISLDFAYTIDDGPIENLGTGKTYDYIQHAINDANAGDEIIVGTGMYQYRENINFKGKNLTVRTKDLNEPANLVGAVHRPVVRFSEGENSNCVMAGFTIAGGNNGIFCEDGASPTITGCSIGSNRYSGIHVRGKMGIVMDSGVTISNCTIVGNGRYGIESSEIWRGCKGPVIKNCVIAGNKMAGFWGDGPTFINCTVVGNGGNGIRSYLYNKTITNSIVWNNADSEIEGSLIVTHCNIKGGWPGIENIDQEPLFVSPGYWADIDDPNIIVEPDDPNAVWIDGDYHLLSGSPCIDSGDPCYIPGPNETDLDGRPRILLGRIDMGAYEFNHIPIADAGPNTTVYAGIDGTAQATLDGTGSYDDDGQPLTYFWSWSIDGNDYDVNGPIQTINLPVGKHIINLTVNDGVEDSEPDEVAITVIPPIEVQMKLTPQVLNPRSKGRWLKAHFVLPEGFSVEDVDTDTPAVIAPFGVESYNIKVLIDDDGLVRVVATFRRSDLCHSITSYDRNIEVMVIGRFNTGRYFYGTDIIKITNRAFDHLAILVSQWLEADCGRPDWCGAADLNQDSVVNFIDFALLNRCCIEVIK